MLPVAVDLPVMEQLQDGARELQVERASSMAVLVVLALSHMPATAVSVAAAVRTAAASAVAAVAATQVAQAVAVATQVAVVDHITPVPVRQIPQGFVPETGRFPLPVTSFLRWLLPEL
jgi:hypothetical protein